MMLLKSTLGAELTGGGIEGEGEGDSTLDEASEALSAADLDFHGTVLAAD